MSEDHGESGTEPQPNDKTEKITVPLHRLLTREHLGGGVAFILLVEIVQGCRGHWRDPESIFLLGVVIFGASVWAYAEMRHKKASFLLAVILASLLAFACSGIAFTVYALLGNSRLAQPAPPVKAANEATPARPSLEAKREFPKFNENIDRYYFSMGGPTFSESSNRLQNGPWTPMRFGNETPVVLRVGRGEFAADVNMPLYPDGRRIILKNNELFGKFPLWDMNSNERALEVVNEEGTPIFQLILKNDSFIEVQGNFIISGTHLVTSDGERMTPIFRYPSWKYPGILQP